MRIPASPTCVCGFASCVSKQSAPTLTQLTEPSNGIVNRPVPLAPVPVKLSVSYAFVKPDPTWIVLFGKLLCADCA